MRVVVLTGAGISAECGIGTFRQKDGLWEQHRIEDVATPEAFLRDPALVHRFYSERRSKLFSVEPGAAHLALAEFEQAYQGPFTLITQNVDDLHQRAGSKHVLAMHGELRKVRCRYTDEVWSWDGDTFVKTLCPSCGVADHVRPHIVWFGEVPFFLKEIQRAVANAEVFVSIGTSGHVYPAAGLVSLARRCGAKTIEWNLEPSQNSSEFDEGVYGLASEIVPRELQRLKALIA